MKLILRDIANEFIKSVSFEKFEICQKNMILKLGNIKRPAKANLITSNEKIRSHELAQFQVTLKNHNVNLTNIYSNNRETVFKN